MAGLMNHKFTPFAVETSGTGHWSTAKKSVRITGINFEDFREVQVSFDADTWDVIKDGLIYTDPGFLDSLKTELAKQFPSRKWDRLQYTEQGMQGKWFVSLEFIT